MILIANLFPKLQTVNIFVRPLTKKRRFRPRFYSEHVKASLNTSEISMRALVSCFLFHFWNLHQILIILKKNVIVIANVSPKLQAMNILVRPLSKKRCFRTGFESQHVKRPKRLQNLHESTFIMFFYHSQ